MRIRRRPDCAYLVASLLCILLGLATAMCSTDSNGVAKGGLTLLLVDDPIDTVTSLSVNIDSIEVHGNGPPTQLTLNKEIDQPVNILELENGLFATLVKGNDNENLLPAGTYGNLKFHISEAWITFTDSVDEIPTEATVPPGKFNVGGPFTISEGQITELYLVFHANNALHETGGGEYTVHPSLKLVAKSVSGSVIGSVYPAPGPGDNPGEETRVKVLANRGTDNEASTFAAEGGSFELVPLREGSHSLSVEWITLKDGNVDECLVHDVSGVVEVVAGQATDVGPIALPPGAADCS